ncbi:MAG: methylated-DNA--[protein]-cysteine S-methyltransferase [Clostridium sp.]
MMYKKTYNSSLGTIYMRSDGEYLTGLWFENSRDSSKHIGDFEEKDLPIFEETSKWLDIYFSGTNPNFVPKYKIENLTPFRKLVIDIMNKIPYGQVITYNDIAKEIAQLKGIKKMSAQAVGGAVGWNPICIIIPCHRVVGTNGSLTGYGGGIQNKVKLLELEKNDMSKFTIPTRGTAL